MEAPLQTPQLERYDGAERRRSFGVYPGAERRVLDPSTEQDHPEQFYPEPSGQFGDRALTSSGTEP